MMATESGQCEEGEEGIGTLVEALMGVDPLTEPRGATVAVKSTFKTEQPVG